MCLAAANIILYWFPAEVDSDTDSSSLLCRSFQEALVGEKEYETKKERESTQVYK